MKLVDRISAIFFIVLCVFAFVEARHFSPLSGLFPRVVIVLLGSLSLLQFIDTFFRREEKEEWDSAAFRHIPSLLSLAMMAGWVVFMPIAGFLVSSLIFFPGITIYLDRKATGKKILGRLGITWAITVAFWLFFSKILYVPFPEGFLI